MLHIMDYSQTKAKSLDSRGLRIIPGELKLVAKRQGGTNSNLQGRGYLVFIVALSFYFQIVLQGNCGGGQNLQG